MPQYPCAAEVPLFPGNRQIGEFLILKRSLSFLCQLVQACALDTADKVTPIPVRQRTRTLLGTGRQDMRAAFQQPAAGFLQNPETLRRARFHKEQQLARCLPQLCKHLSPVFFPDFVDHIRGHHQISPLSNGL